jgi:hypothetical protein
MKENKFYSFELHSFSFGLRLSAALILKKYHNYIYPALSCFLLIQPQIISITRT